MRLGRVHVVVALVAGLLSADLVFGSTDNLVVLQIGDGVNALSSSSAPVTLKRFATTGGSALESYAFPTSGAGALTIGGTALTEGHLTLNDGYIGLGGYAADAGTPDIVKTSTTGDGAVLREAVAFDASLSLTAGPALSATTIAHSGGNIRTSIVSGGNFYTIGGADNSPMYVPAGAVADPGVMVVPSGLNNVRSIQVINGDLYVSAHPTSRGIYKIAGTPTTTDNVATLAVATPKATNQNQAVALGDFWISPDFSVAYVADESNVGGIHKYVSDGSGGYTHVYTIGTDYDADGPAVSGARTFAVDASGANPVLYVTSEDGSRLMSVTDTGDKATADATLTTLETADANTAFRGVLLAPALSSPPHLTGDTNHDGVVDLTDLNNVLNNFGSAGSGNPGDDNADNVVDLTDLNNVLNNFGSHAAAAASALSAVPEPSVVGALGVAAVIGGVRRRRRRR
jgi:hypothetical protein